MGRCRRDLLGFSSKSTRVVACSRSQGQKADAHAAPVCNKIWCWGVSVGCFSLPISASTCTGTMWRMRVVCRRQMWPRHTQEEQSRGRGQKRRKDQRLLERRDETRRDCDGKLQRSASTGLDWGSGHGRWSRRNCWRWHSECGPRVWIRHRRGEPAVWIRRRRAGRVIGGITGGPRGNWGRGVKVRPPSCGSFATSAPATWASFEAFDSPVQGSSSSSSTIRTEFERR